jgi:hypothetical protein
MMILLSFIATVLISIVIIEIRSRRRMAWLMDCRVAALNLGHDAESS